MSLGWRGIHERSIVGIITAVAIIGIFAIETLVRPRLIIEQGLRTPTGLCFGSSCASFTRGLSFRWPFMKHLRHRP